MIRPKLLVGVIVVVEAFSAAALGAPPPKPPSPPVVGITSPRPPANAAASLKAIDALAPFLGAWRGTEVQHLVRDFTRSAYRNVSRPGDLDVVLLEQGIYLDSRPLRLAFDVIAFNVKARRYEVYMPGYRVSTGDEGTSQLVELVRPDPSTLIWSESTEGVASRRTTVTVDGPNWRERIENVLPDGRTILLSEINLTRDHPPAP